MKVIYSIKKFVYLDKERLSYIQRFEDLFDYLLFF